MYFSFLKIIRERLTLKIVNYMLFGIICLAFFFVTGIISKASLFGDGQEYLFMQEAFVNHFSPDIRPVDLETSQQILYAKGDTVADGYLSGLKGLLLNNPTPGQQYWGAFIAENGKAYCYHFWMYSLCCMPVDLFLKAFHFNQLKSFQITNLLLIFLVIWYLLFKSRLTELQKFIAGILFLFSGTIWYILRTHPEIFSASLLFLALLLLYDRRYYLSVLLASVASFQNPPILFTVAFILFKYYLDNGFQFKKLLMLGITGSVSLLPMLFYYWYFGSPNLIMKSGMTDSSFISAHRLLSLFFDLNQGLILSIPLVFLVFLGHAAYRITFHLKKSLTSISYILLLILLAIPSLPQRNWNMGAVIISRYALWISMPVLIYLVMEIKWDKLYKKIGIAVILISQVYLVTSKGGLLAGAGGYVQFNKLSRFVLDHCPSIYNPDPEIFGERALGHEEVHPNDSPVKYFDSKGNLKKIMVYKDYLDSLSVEYPELKNSRHKVYNGWVYINFQ